MREAAMGYSYEDPLTLSPFLVYLNDMSPADCQ